MFKYLLKFIKFAGKQRKHMIIALVFGLLQSIFTAFSLLATAYALQNMIEGTATMSTVWSAFGIVGGGVLLAAVCNYFSTQFLTYAGYTIAANARIRIADKLKYAPMGYFNEHNLGQIANTATNTAESLQDTLTRCLLLTTKGLFMALVITISLLVFAVCLYQMFYPQRRCQRQSVYCTYLFFLHVFQTKFKRKKHLPPQVLQQKGIFHSKKFVFYSILLCFIHII